MSKKTKKQLLRSILVQDKNGKQYTINEYQILNTKPPVFGDTSEKWVKGMKEFRCENSVVNRIDENTYQMFGYENTILTVI